MMLAADRKTIATADAGGRLDDLYRSFDHVTSATDPVHIVRRFKSPADREVVGFCAAALAFGRVASVLQSIESLLAVMGQHPAQFVRGFDPARERSRLEPLVHRWISGRDLMALLIVLQRMLTEAGSIEAFFLEGDEASSPNVGPALDSFSARALATDMRAAYGKRVPRQRGVSVLLSAACCRQRLQAAQSVPAVDGSTRRDRPWRLVEGLACATDRAARYPRHPPGPMFEADALHQPGMEDGPRHHERAASVRLAGSGSLRFRAVPRRDDERLWLSEASGQRAVPPARLVRSLWKGSAPLDAEEPLVDRHRAVDHVLDSKQLARAFQASFSHARSSSAVLQQRDDALGEGFMIARGN